MPNSYYKVHARTLLGLDLLAKQQAGAEPELTRAVASSGFVPGEDKATVIANLEQLTEITDIIAPMQMDKPVHIDKCTVRQPLRLLNTALDSTALIRRVVVFALDPDLGEIPYQVVQFATPQEVPSLEANDNQIFAYNINVNVTFANAEGAVIPFDPGWFISREEFDAVQPTEEVATIQHNLGTLPIPALYSGKYAYGLGGYGESPYGGSSILSVPVRLEPLDYNTTKVFTIPRYAGTPTVNKLEDHMFALIYPDSVESLTLILR